MVFQRCKAAPLLALFGLVVAMPSGWADDRSLDDSFRLSGFGTVGLTHSGAEGLRYRRDLSRSGSSSDSWAFETDTLLGVQLDATLTPELDAAVQFVARDRPKGGVSESLEWAFLRYQPTQELTFRAGRLGVDIFMLSEYRNVGFAYLWARPPMEFYAPMAFESFDGADLTYNVPVGEGMLRVKLFTGSATEDFSGIVSNDYSSDSSSYGTSLTWESERWVARVAAVTGMVENTVESAQPLVDALRAVPAVLWPEAGELAGKADTKDKRITYYSAGLRYDPSPWSFLGVIGFIDSKVPTTPLASAYASAARRNGPVTVYGIAAIAKNPNGRKIAPPSPLPAFAPLQQAIQLGHDLSFIDQHSLSTGLRWDIRHDVALKVQWDHTWIDNYGGGLWAQEFPFSEPRELDTLSINLNVVF